MLIILMMILSGFCVLLSFLLGMFGWLVRSLRPFKYVSGCEEGYEVDCQF